MAGARLVTELLLQSVGDVIRIFPAWPAGADARFTDLPAQGGFAVSADQVGGTIGNVKVRSTVGGTAKLLSPWTHCRFTVVEEESKADVAVKTDAGICSFPTTAGKTYFLRPGK